MKANDARRLRELEGENTRLKKLLAASAELRGQTKIDLDSELLVATLGDIGVMADEADSDPLRLWALALARRRLHERVRVMSFSALDEFAIYRLATLQPAAAEVVMLRVVHELSVAEVAAITGRSETNVRVLAHRALERLRCTLDEAASATSGPAFDLGPA